MSSTSIRRATTADLPAIRQLITDAYEKYIERIGRPPAPMTADYTAALEHSRVWVLVSDDAVVGALVTEHRGDHLLLETIAVAPGAQGHGYGRMLLDRAEGDAAELGLTEVRLYTNEAMTENLTLLSPARLPRDRSGRRGRLPARLLLKDSGPEMTRVPSH